MSTLPDRYVMLGAGGHARVLQETLALQGITLDGFIAPSADSQLVGTEWLGTDDAFSRLDPASVLLVNGVGSVRAPALRREIYTSALAAGFRFATVIDQTAVVRPSVVLGAGVQVLAGAIVNTDAVVGENSIVNTGAIVEHGARVGAHVHIAPGAKLAGDVTVGEESHIGLGASVMQGISVGSQCTVGAGAVVTRDVSDGSTAVGVPAISRPAS